MQVIKQNGGTATLTGVRPTAALMATLPSLEGRRRWNGKDLVFEATAHNIRTIQNVTGAKIEGVDDEATRLIEAAARDAVKAMRVKVDRKTTPFPHQEAALEHFIGKEYMALFMEQGTGKTKTSIDWADDLYANGDISGILVVTRKGVHRQWAMSEFPRHMASPFSVTYWGQKGNPLPQSGGLQIITINWDGIKTDKGRAWVHEFCHRHSGRLLIIADEAQDMKNYKSGRHKEMQRLKPFSSHRSVLTGTPIAKDLTDEWAILNWLNEDILGIKYITTFRAQYCIMGGFEGRAVVGHKEIGRFRDLTAPWVFRVRKEDIGLLPKQYDEWAFGLLPAQRSMIKQIRDDLMMQVDGGDAVRLDHAASAMIKVQQISNGFAIDDEGVTHRLMPVDKNPRVIAAMEWLQGSDSKAIIWCKFREDIAILQEAIGSNYVTYMGGIKDDERQAAIDSFLSVDGVQVLLATDAASTGLNLQGLCNRALYYSEGFNAINRWQKEDRIDRIGTVGFTTHTDLIAIGSVDRHIARNRFKKKGISDMAIEGLNGGFAAPAAQLAEPPKRDIMDILYSFAGSTEWDA